MREFCRLAPCTVNRLRLIRRHFLMECDDRRQFDNSHDFPPLLFQAGGAIREIWTRRTDSSCSSIRVLSDSGATGIRADMMKIIDGRTNILIRMLVIAESLFAELRRGSATFIMRINHAG